MLFLQQYLRLGRLVLVPPPSFLLLDHVGYREYGVVALGQMGDSGAHVKPAALVILGEVGTDHTKVPLTGDWFLADPIRARFVLEGKKQKAGKQSGSFVIRDV